MAGTLKNLGNGRYKLTVSLGYQDGKQIRKCRTVDATTKKEAERMLAKFYLEQTRFAGLDKDITFGDFVKVFQERHANNLSLSCRTNYEYMLHDRILPAFGKQKLSKVTKEMIIRFIEFLKDPLARMDKQQKPLSGETVRKHYKLIQLILNKAVVWGFLNGSPCDRFPVDDVLPKANTKHYPILPTRELTRLLHLVDELKDTAGSVRNKLFFYICLTTGTRRGEVAGLTWDQVDLDNHTINIVQSLKSVSGKPKEMGEPKTKKSVRVLYFDEHLEQLFRKHKAYQDEWLSKNGYHNKKNLVFVLTKVTNEGETNYMNPHSVYDWLSALCRRNNIPHIGLHSLRAQCATLSASIGIPLNLVSAQLGHSDSTVTAKIYVRDMADLRREASDRMFDKLGEIRGQ